MINSNFNSYAFPANRTEQDLIAVINHVNEAADAFRIKKFVAQTILGAGTISAIATAIFYSAKIASIIQLCTLVVGVGLLLSLKIQANIITNIARVIQYTSKGKINEYDSALIIEVNDSLNHAKLNFSVHSEFLQYKVDTDMGNRWSLNRISEKKP